MNYRQRLLNEYQTRTRQHDAENLKFDCLNCAEKTEYHQSLCAYCEQLLVRLLEAIDPAVQWLTIMGEIEARSVSTPNGGGKHMVSETSNLTPATLLADEIESFATRAARWLSDELAATSHQALMRRGDEQLEPGKPGKYLASHKDYLVRQPWVRILINGYRDLDAGMQIRGLKTLLAEQRAKWPKATDQEPARHLTGLPCLNCGNETLWLHPANYAGQAIAIICEAAFGGVRCGWACREDAQDFLTQMATMYDQLAELKRTPRMEVTA